MISLWLVNFTTAIYKEISTLGNCSAQRDVSCAKFPVVPRQLLLDAFALLYQSDLEAIK